MKAAPRLPAEPFRASVADLRHTHLFIAQCLRGDHDELPSICREPAGGTL